MYEFLLNDAQRGLLEEVRDLVRWVPRQMVLDMDADVIRFPKDFLREAARLKLEIKDAAGQVPTYPILVTMALGGTHSGTLILDPDGRRVECKQARFLWHERDAQGNLVALNEEFEYRMGTRSAYVGAIADPQNPGQVKPVWGTTESLAIEITVPMRGAGRGVIEKYREELNRNSNKDLAGFMLAELALRSGAEDEVEGIAKHTRALSELDGRQLVSQLGTQEGFRLATETLGRDACARGTIESCAAMAEVVVRVRDECKKVGWGAGMQRRSMPECDWMNGVNGDLSRRVGEIEYQRVMKRHAQDPKKD